MDGVKVENVKRVNKVIIRVLRMSNWWPEAGGQHCEADVGEVTGGDLHFSDKENRIGESTGIRYNHSKKNKSAKSTND